MKGIVKIDDKISNHGCQGSPHNDKKIISGSSDVFVNGKGVAREGDLVECGDTLAKGSDVIYVNNKSVSRLYDPTTFHKGACDYAKIIIASDNVFIN